ncbi:hydrogen peroxide-inducible genes activator [Novosphingobium aquimarinum]|uniref:hydrogen peroxide-inducible genes activator n=1 Tax=Novosphingobium aquimarinum TaxID=2682494 RepID=UPI0012EC4945|nr:hydrogen peroxide-inducible genes activator [Novosphingobium aquimarinum]
MEPTLRQLRYLVALAEHEGFSRGAAAEGVSQPSFSQAIRNLEDLLGYPLAERGTRAIMTPLGREAVLAARMVLAEVDAFMSLAQRDQAEGTGTLRLGVSPTLGPYLLPKLVAELHRAKPNLRVHVREGLPSELIRMLTEAEHDVVLVQLPIGEPGLHVERLFRDPLLVAMAPEDPLAAKEAIEISDLEGRGLLTLLPQYRLSEQIQTLAQAAGAHVRRDYEGTSLDAIRQMAGLGMGLAIIPQLYARQEVRGNDVVVKPFAGGRFYREVGLVWRKGAGLSPTFQSLAELLKCVA